MVVPMGAGGMGGPPGADLPPPEVLQRYTLRLGVLCCCYGVVIFVGFCAGAFSNMLNDVFVALAAGFMAFKSQQCLGQCMLPFMLFAFMAAFFDVISVFQLSMLNRTFNHPGGQDLFASNCSYNILFVVPRNTTVYTVQNNMPNQPMTLTTNTTVMYPQDLCSIGWVLSNVCIIMSCVLDITASFLGWRMFKATQLAGGGGPGGMQMMGVMGADGGGGAGGFPGGAPGMGGGSFPGGAGRGGGMPAQQQQGFQAFQGRGQTVGGP